MTEQNTISPIEISFKDFFLKNKRNRTIILITGLALFIQFAVFKYLYPYASYIHGDSFSYISAANSNLSINTYMVGYSNFLRLFSVFFKSDLVLTSFQYLFIQSSVLYLLFTIFYLYNTGKVVQVILLCFMVFNPLFLHLANLVSSDGVFLGLSLIWFTLLIWIVRRPSRKVVIWHAVVLIVVFTIRYNALIYPFISAVAFWLSRLPAKNKIIGLGAAATLCAFFVVFTSYKYKTLTGSWQYSPFGGWQLANNAMYAYRYVDSARRIPVPKKYQALDNMIREFFDTTKDVKKFPSEEAKASTYYMWSPGMSLMKYRDSLFKVKKDTTASELKKWATMGPFYKEYGLYIIKQYPLHFARHFLWPNSCKYYAPPVEFLQTYNSGSNGVTQEAKEWFGYKSMNINTRMKNPKVWILDFYPILSCVINLLMLFSLLYYMLSKGWQYVPVYNEIIMLGTVVWLLNAGFTIFASSAALRFQSFPVILTTILVLLLLDLITMLVNKTKTEIGSQKEVSNFQKYNDQLTDQVVV